MDERLFALFAVEQFNQEFKVYSGVWGDVKSGAGREYITSQLRSLVAYQRLQYDLLRRHAEQWKDDAFASIYGDYAEQLDHLGDDLDQFERLSGRSAAQVARVRQAAAMNALGAGLLLGIGSAAQGDDDAVAFLRGAAAAQDAQRAQHDQVAASVAAQDAKVKAAFDAFTTSFDQRVAVTSLKFRRKVDASRWKAEHFYYRQAQTKGGPGRNPFLVVSVAELDCSERDTPLATLVARAELCAKQAEAVPLDAAYDPYRAMFLGVAGRLACRGAAKDLGATGFPASRDAAPAAGTLARRVWVDYFKYESVDQNLNDEVIHGAFMACAYAGDPAEAFETLVAYAAERSTTALPRRPATYRAKAAFSTSPAFWYDAARVSSAAGRPGLAGECLRLAVKCGFGDRAAAQVCPDLKNLREDPKYGKLFDAAFNPSSSSSFR